MEWTHRQCQQNPYKKQQQQQANSFGSQVCSARLDLAGSLWSNNNKADWQAAQYWSWRFRFGDATALQMMQLLGMITVVVE
jgi:hypothetical protein